jgi:hypothetical protein
MMRHYGYSLNLLLVLAIGGCLINFTGCGPVEKQGKFTEAQMDRFGSAPQMTLPDLTGGVVLSIGKETITADEVILSLENEEQQKVVSKRRDLRQLAKNLSLTEFSAQISTQTGDIVFRKARDILLYEKAKADAGDKIDDQLDQFVETEKSSFIARHGNNTAEAEKAFKRKGINDWKAFEDTMKGDMLRSMYLSKRTATIEPITYNQMRAYYNEYKEKYAIEGSMEFLLIDLIPSKLKPEQVDIAMGRSTDVVALELGKELVERIRNGEDFGEIARKYSHGINANDGGRDKVTYDGAENYGVLVDPHDVLEKLAEKMEVGKISDPLETKGHVFIMKLIAYKKRYIPAFENVRDEIEGELERYRREMQEYKISVEMMSETNVADLEKFVNMCVMQAYRRWSGK